MPDQDHLFQRVVQEAVIACGADMAAIERYIADRLGAMSDDDRRRISRDIQRVLGFRDPPGPPYQTN